MSQIAYSSIPGWARPTPEQGVPEDGAPENAAPIDLSGSSYLVIGVGDSGKAAAKSARSELPEVPVEVILADDVATATSAARSAIADSTVGLRVLISGPTGACLRLRGVAVAAGLEDDEVTVRPCATAEIDVFCSHCGASTATPATIDDVIDCIGCGRHLLVYHHVSRRTGQYLGFMVDAETPPAERIVAEKEPTR